MNRKTVIALALSSALAFPVSMAYADGDGTKEAPKPEFIAQSDEKPEAPKPELVAQSDEKPEAPKPELTADAGDSFPQGSSPELVG